GGEATTHNVAAARDSSRGSPTTIAYNPDVKREFKDQDGETHETPQGEILGHEMIHAAHNAQGENQGNIPDPKDPSGNVEESRTIGNSGQEGGRISDNKLLDDWGAGFRRTNHGNDVVTTR